MPEENVGWSIPIYLDASAAVKLFVNEDGSVRLEDFIGRISAYEPGLLAADYTTLHKRISKQDLGIDIPENDAVVAVDSTGIKVTNRGGLNVRETWNATKRIT